MENVGEILNNLHRQNTSGQKNIKKNSRRTPEQNMSEKMYSCKDCLDLKWIGNQESVGSLNFGKLIPCKCQEIEINLGIKKIVTESIIDNLGDISLEILNKKTFATFEARNQNLVDAVTLAKNYTKDFDGFFLVTGPTGVGKTHLALAIAGIRIKKSLPVYFSFMPNLLDKLRRSFNLENSSSKIDFEEIINFPFLILDDLGSENSSNWTDGKIYQIIVQRHNLKLPTVITTRNIEENPFDYGQYTEGIRSRLNDNGIVNAIHIGSPDYRSN